MIVECLLAKKETRIIPGKELNLYTKFKLPLYAIQSSGFSDLQTFSTLEQICPYL